ncbi:helix-turn-helix domain-containing protein [Micromonospora sp. GCM10011542]|uniref:helix-turn-helix domain-containing protein n=1 Tax=Micromonospora sp. GCM10011542 TaxID=3317337 RepID=UPI00361698AF
MAGGDGAVDVGAVLRELRRQADLSQRELAERSGVPKSTLARIEAGRDAEPGFRTVERLVRGAGGELVVGPREGACRCDGDASLSGPEDEPRDEVGRRYPAHLDVRPVRTLKDWPGTWWLYSSTLPPERWPSRVPDFTYDLDRARRDERRWRQRMRGQVSFRRTSGVGMPETSRRYVAELSDGEVVGELRAHERSVDLFFGEDLGDQRELVLESVVVPELRWLGIGRRLIEFLAAETSRSRIRTVRAVAEWGGVHFLLACGFELQAGRPSALALRL